MPTVVEGDFEWDSEKAAANLVKHGVPFLKRQRFLPILLQSILTTVQALATES